MIEVGFLPFHARQVIPGKGVIQLRKKPSTQKIGPVLLKSLGPDKFQLEWRDPITGTRQRRRLSCSKEQAEAAAVNVSSEVLTGKGFTPGRPTSRTPTITDGIAEAIRVCGGNKTTKVDLGKRAAPFTRWMGERYPRVNEWSDLRPGMIREYVSELVALGRAYDTIRMRLVPIKMAWRKCSEDYPGIVHPLPRIKIPNHAPVEIKSLDPSEVAVLIHWMKANAPSLAPVVILMALTGLRTREAIHLRRCDVNLEKGLVRVTETALHRPKNRSSYREIPIPSEALESLTEAIQGQRVAPIGEGEIFRTKYGASWENNILTQRFRKLLLAASEETGIAAFREIPIRKLRSSFASMAFALGVNPEVLRRYMGHSGGILERHYMKVGMDDLREVSSRMEQWRSLLFQGQNGKKWATLKEGHR